MATYVRCYHCSAEQKVIGPAWDPICESEGWKLDGFEFYNPHGHHYCPLHQRQAWLAYCATFMVNGDYDCEACIAGGGIVIDAPFAMESTEVLDELAKLGVRCAGSNRIIGLEEIAETYRLERDVRGVAVRSQTAASRSRTVSGGCWA